MRKIPILFMILLLVISCNSIKKEKELTIVSTNDTVEYGGIFQAELYVPYNDNILPVFYIVEDDDTSMLEIDKVKRCATFRAIGRGKGEETYRGYAEYIDSQGKRKSEKFSLKYYVKPQE